ncbi:AraC family transcriptional regulator [Paenibacillus sp. GYB004]|uniref:AraC family transcriptional regulator n=1 Tax=Paenibacillus sp. GYB004 TaxID=2994393 RepID=UPI002F96DDF7
MRIRSFNMHTLQRNHTGKSGGIHPYGELLCVRAGHAVLEWMGTEYTASSPNLFVLAPDTPHRIIRVSEPLRFWYVELDMEPNESFFSVEQAMLWNRFQKTADYTSSSLWLIGQTLEHISYSADCLRSEPAAYDEELVRLDLEKTIRLIRRQLQTADTASGYADTSTKAFVQRLMRHMETNYYEPIDIETLSKRVHLNPSYVIRSFKSIAGVTPIQYLHKLRLNAAISLLSHTDMAVHRIAEETGFNSVHYFSRLFKQKHGISPQQWRDERQGKR